MAYSTRRGMLERPVRINYGNVTLLRPPETSDDCWKYLHRLVRALGKHGRPSDDDVENRGAACFLLGFALTALIKDPIRREEFLSATWNAHKELLPPTVEANATVRSKISETHARDARAKV
jgi:hypothetical protein